MVHECMPIQNNVVTEITFIFDSSCVLTDNYLDKILDKIENSLQKRENCSHVKIIFK